MNNLTYLLPLLAIFSTIFINIRTGLFTDSDTLKLIWMYTAVLPIILFCIVKNKIQIIITWPIIISFLPIAFAILSTIINNQINPYFSHDLSVAIMAIFIALYFQDTDIQKVWKNLILITIVLTLIIFAWTLISVNYYSYDPNTILLGNRNLTANYLVISLPILLYALFFEKKILKVFSLLSIVSILLLIIFYYPSRFAMILSVFSIAIYSAIELRKINRNLKILILITIISLVALALFNYSRFDRLLNFAGYYDRLIVYKIGLEAINNQYILGYGLGSTSHVIDNFRIFQQDFSIYFDDTQFGQLHNEPLQYFIEGGFFAFLAYFIFILILFKNFLFLYFKCEIIEDIRIKLLPLGLAISIGFLHSMVDIGIKSPFNRSFLYLLIGVFLSVAIKSKKSHR